MKKKFFYTLLFVIFIIFCILSIKDVKAMSFYDYHTDRLVTVYPEGFDNTTHWIFVYDYGVVHYKYCWFYTNDEDFSRFVVDGYNIYAINTSGEHCKTYYAEGTVFGSSSPSQNDVDNMEIVKVYERESINRLFLYIQGCSSTYIYNLDGSIWYTDKYNFEVTYHDDNTFAELFSRYFDYSDFNNIFCEISSDGINFTEMNKDGAEPDGESSFLTFVFWYYIYNNGTYDIRFKNANGEILSQSKIYIDGINEDFVPLNFHLSTTDRTSELYILSDEFCFDSWDSYNFEDDFTLDYDVEIKFGVDSKYEKIYSITEYNDELTSYRSRYEYQVFSNGIYELRITHKETKKVFEKTFIVDNYIFNNPYGDDIYYNNYNEDGKFDPTPVLFLDYIDTTTVRIRTQPFTFNELLYLECYVSSDNEKYERNNNIYNFTIDLRKDNYTYMSDDKRTSLDTYYFYYDVKVDGTYYFKFYNIELKKYTIGSIDVNIQKFLTDNIDNIEKYPDRFVIWGEKHFGVLIYPFRFIINIFGKINNIAYSQPILHIQELHDPFFDYKILDAIDFNFNSILTNNVVKTIYNIYLISVDFILIMLFVSLCKKTFSEVFNK